MIKDWWGKSVNDPIAYTYEADHHCPSCAEARFGRDEYGDIASGVKDGEGNEPGAMFSWEEWYNIGYGNQTLACGTCHDVIAEYEEDET